MVMAQVLIRDLSNEALKQLKRRAAENHRSLQGELHAIITQTVESEKSGKAPVKKLEARSPRALYSANVAPARRMREDIGYNLIPDKGAKRNKAAPTGSVWDWLKRRAAGKMSKKEIDEYIRAERDSWSAP
jgi:plasmid stability protein